MQKELEHGRPALIKQLLEFFDLIEPLSHHLVRDPAVDLRNKDVLIVGAIENPDVAFGGAF